MRFIYNHLGPILLIGILVSPCTVVADSNSYPVTLDAWKQWWLEMRAEEIDLLIEGLSEESLASLDDDKRSILVADIRRLLESKISWESFGQEIVMASLQKNCGEDMLIELEHYISGQLDAESIDDELKKQYSICEFEVSYRAKTTFYYQVLEVSHKHISSLYERHGVSVQ